LAGAFRAIWKPAREHLKVVRPAPQGEPVGIATAISKRIKKFKQEATEITEMKRTASSLFPLFPPVQTPLPWINDFRRHDLHNGKGNAEEGIDGRRFFHGPAGGGDTGFRLIS
jgi:hypothetical protein